MLFPRVGLDISRAAFTFGERLHAFAPRPMAFAMPARRLTGEGMREETARVEESLRVLQREKEKLKALAASAR